MRGSERRERVIQVSAARAWGVVGRPEVLHHWFPGVVDCVVDGHTRTITTGVGISMAEDILTNDPIQRRFQYRIAGGVFREHLASIDVIELTPDSCLVTYATDADPAPMAVVLGGATAAALDELATQLERGSGPALDAVAALGPIDVIPVSLTEGSR